MAEALPRNVWIRLSITVRSVSLVMTSGVGTVRVGLVVSSTSSCGTVIIKVSINPPSILVTFMVALPLAFAVTKPVLLTDAMAVSLDDHNKALLLAFDGSTVAASWAVSVIFKV